MWFITPRSGVQVSPATNIFFTSKSYEAADASPAAAFSSSVSLGILTSLAVIAHEAPQELGDFVILDESGWRRWAAYWANFLSSLATFAGALVAYFALGFIAPRIPFFLTISAASFLYVGMVDLAPIPHHDSGLKKSLLQLARLLAGAGTILLLHRALG